MEWIKFIEEDYSTWPEHSGNWDDTSKEVIVHYTVGPFNIHTYSLGYTDWDGDNHYWNIKGVKYPYKIISYAYFDKEL